jgi:UrcA family protein
MTITTAIESRRRLVLGSFCALYLALTGPAAAGSADDSMKPRSVTVKYGDLNLNNAEGLKTLYARLARAARRVCSAPSGHLLSDVSYGVSDCRRNAIAAAVASVNNERLAALHRQRTERKSG